MSALSGQVLKFSLDIHGCHVVEKALDEIQFNQRVLLFEELKPHIITCATSPHGNFVIQKCVERLPANQIHFIIASLHPHAYQMAKHQYGCRVIQRVINYSSWGILSKIFSLVDEFFSAEELQELAFDPYGNYVLQCLFCPDWKSSVRQRFLNLVGENIIKFSCNKYASNVVQNMLRCGNFQEQRLLIQKMLDKSGHAERPLVVMINDKFGNYIVQDAIKVADSSKCEEFMAQLQVEFRRGTVSDNFGKHILHALSHG